MAELEEKIRGNIDVILAETAEIQSFLDEKVGKFDQIERRFASIRSELGKSIGSAETDLWDAVAKDREKRLPCLRIIMGDYRNFYEKMICEIIEFVQYAVDEEFWKVFVKRRVITTNKFYEIRSLLELKFEIFSSSPNMKDVRV